MARLRESSTGSAWVLAGEIKIRIKSKSKKERGRGGIAGVRAGGIRICLRRGIRRGARGARWLGLFGAFGDDAVVTWGILRGTSKGAFAGVPPGGGTFAVPFVNVARFQDGRMAGESIYFDLATLCDQSRIPIEKLRAAAKTRAQALGSRAHAG